MKLTTVQIITLLALIAFAVYELWYIPKWLETVSDDNPVIRTDLIIFPTILFILIIISVIQFFRRKKKV